MIVRLKFSSRITYRMWSSLFCIPMCVICAFIVVACATMLHLAVFILGGHCYRAAMEFFNDDSHVIGAYSLIWWLGGL